MKTTTCNVWCSLPRGLHLKERFPLTAFDGQPPPTTTELILKPGLNLNVDRATIERWMNRKAGLTISRKPGFYFVSDNT